LPALLGDNYVDLQIAACHMAEKHPRKAFKEALAKILKTGKEPFLLNAATEAAEANGVTVEQMADIWLERMKPGDLGKNGLRRLMVAVLNCNKDYAYGDLGVLGNSDVAGPQLTSEQLANADSLWRRFVERNRLALRQGRRFKPGDSELTTDMFPSGFTFYFDNKPWPPTPAESGRTH
jgi:hypothetical protein